MILSTVVQCPAISNGMNVVVGCACNAGFSGAVVASTMAPFFNSTCQGEISCFVGQFIFYFSKPSTPVPTPAPKPAPKPAPCSIQLLIVGGGGGGGDRHVL